MTHGSWTRRPRWARWPRWRQMLAGRSRYHSFRHRVHRAHRDLRVFIRL